MMIPGQWERGKGVAAGPPPSAPTPSPRADAGHQAATAEVGRLELPAWLRVPVFAAALLAATWLAMWMKAAAR